MAPFDSSYSSNLTTKLSPLIEGQVPDFVQADHPLFVKFLKNYYEYLEAGELRVTVNIDDLLLEAETISYALDTDGKHITLEDGAGTTGKFVAGETITGETTKATAKILVDDLGNTTKPRLFITSQQLFQTGETITGGTSGATATVTRYRANPVQNIQQLLEYANVDNTIYDFLDQLRDSFMNAIPNNLATGVNKRNLIKNIRELYRAKGTSEGHKIFIRMLLDENATIKYPVEDMLRVSDGKWTFQTILRCSPGTNSIASEISGRTITGQSSGATAVVAAASTTAEGGEAIVIFEINPDSLLGTFTDGETIKGTSSVQDISMSFTVRGMVTSTVVTDGGILYSAEDTIELDTNTAIGNGEALAKVETIKTGSVSDVIIDDAGTLYEVGDTLTFTTTESGTTTKAATGFVSVIDGSIAINGTDNASTNAGDYLTMENESTEHVEFFNFVLDGTDAVGSNDGDSVILNGTDASSTNAGHNLGMEYGISQVTLDSFGTEADRFALEEGTDSSGAISRIFLQDGGNGYSLLPSVTISTTTGTGGALLAVTTDIGAIDNVKITNQGFKYTIAPEVQFRANFVLKDITGTFTAANTLTTHTGTVKDFNSTTNVLETTIEDVVRVILETGDEEEIAVEDNLKIVGDVKDTTVGINNSVDEGDQIVDADGNRIVLNADDTLDEYIVIESGNGLPAGSAIVVEAEDEVFNPPLVLDGTDGSQTNRHDNIVNEDGSGDNIICDLTISIGASSHQLQRILTEQSKLTSAMLSAAGNTLITNSSIDDSACTLILNGTDSSRTNAGGDILNEEHGNNNTIILDGTDSDSTDVGAKLLMNTVAADGNVALDGTDSSSTNAGDNIVNESGIDFSAGTTTITDSGGATATIVASDIAKGTATIGTKAETTPSYGTNVESLIGEDLIRIQDSLFYQAFSYEVQTDSSSADYLTQLKKAVHPAGFAAFGKVSIATAISVAIGTTGSSLGGGYTADTDTFSPILASTFEVLFAEVNQRRLQSVEIAVGDLESVIVLEDGEVVNEGDLFILNGTDSSSSNAGGGILSEVGVFEEVDFNIAVESNLGIGSILLDGTDSSANNSGERILKEDFLDHRNNLVFDGTEPFHILQSDKGDSILITGYTLDMLLEDGAGQLILNGTNSGSANAGGGITSEDVGTILVEDDISSAISRMALDVTPDTISELLNESGGTMQTETSGTGGGANNDVSIVSFVTTQIMIPQPTPRTLSTGSVTLAKDFFTGRSGSIELEIGTGPGNLILSGYNQYNLKGGVDRVWGRGKDFLLEDGSNENHLSGFTFEQLGNYSSDIIVLNGTNGSSANAGDNIILNGTNLDSANAGHNINGESVHSHNSFLIEDILRPSLVLIDESTDFGSRESFGPLEPVGILLEQDTQGSFKQEDESTVSGTHGDDILLEDGLGLGTGNKLLIEYRRIQIEDNINKGTIPLSNYTNSTLEPFTRPADIETRDIGTIHLEDDATESTNILLEAGITSSGIIVLNGTDSDSTDDGNPVAMEAHFDVSIHYGAGAIVLNGTDNSSTNAGGEFFLEFGTFDDFIKNNAVAVDTGTTGGWDSTVLTLDDTSKTFDATV